MKNLANKNFWFVAIMGMVMGLTFVACSPDDDEYGAGFSYNEKNDTSTTPTDTEIPVDSIDWNMDMERSFGYDQSTGRWPSTITVHYIGGKDSTFVAYCPMTSKIEAVAEKIVDPSTPATTYVGVDPEVSLDSTEWYRESDGYYYRTITRQQVAHMSTYDATITSTHVEAKMVLEGKEVYFLHGTESTPTKKEFNTTDGGEKERYSKNYAIEVCDLSMSHHLHGLRYIDLTASTNILREKNEEVTPEPEMPTPELKVRTIKNIPDYTFSPEFSGNQLIGWHKVLPVLATAEDGKDYYFIWVDGKYVAKVAVGKENRVFNSAYFAEGSWRPATLEKDTDGGWKYVFVVNNEGKLKTVAENLALTSGLQNFRKSDNASQTPSVYTEKNYTEYSGRKHVEVIGFDIDMNPLIKTTIGECL